MQQDDPVADAALDWFLRQRDGTHDPQALHDWLQRDPSHLAAFDTVSALWQAPAFSAAVARLPANLAPAPRRRRWRPAAAVLLLAGLAAWQAPDLALVLRADQRTAAGEMRRMALPDGSTMLLNSASAVELDFTEGRRQVALLAGEAFFDVRPDPAHPFRVTGGHGSAEVKGTAFAMRRDPGRDAVVLERGRLEVRCDCSAPPVTLLPGQATQVSDLGPEPATAVDASAALAWRDGRAVFQGVTLGAVVDDLSRHWPGRIVVLHRGLRTVPVSGSYRLDDIPGALASLAAASGAHLTRLPGGLLVLR